MNKGIYFFILCFIILTNLYSEDGILADYSIEGSSAGGAKLKGNLKFMSISKISRLTSAFFYQEKGNPFPELVENDLIINFKTGKKYLVSSDSPNDVMEIPIQEDYEIVYEKKVNINVEKNPDNLKINLILSQGSSSKPKVYNLTLEPIKPDSKEENTLKNFDNTSILEIFSMFIDNEKIIDIIAKNLGEDKNKIIKKFNIKIEDVKSKIDINGKLENKALIKLTDDDFKF